MPHRDERNDALTRRDFVRLLGAGGAAAFAAACASSASQGDSAAAAGAAASTAAAGGTPLGIQLYTVRDPIGRDPQMVLTRLAQIGYREVETAGTAGKSPAEFRAMMDAAGVRSPSGHYPIEQQRADFAGVIAQAKTLGQTWIVCPWLGENLRTAEGFRALATDINRFARQARDAGLRYAYHNHDFEFTTMVDGKRAYDYLLAQTDPALVEMELDLYWISKAGQKPADYFARFPGRFPLVHVKDMTAAGAMADVGAGTIDFGAIFANRNAGIKHWFVERDDAPDPLASAAASFPALRRLRA